MDLPELLSRQDDVVGRDQALTHVSPAALRHRLRPGGPWRRLLPAVYLATTGRATRRQLLVAALLHTGPDAQLTGPTALELHGVRAGASEQVHLLLPHRCSSRSWSPLVVQRSHRIPLPVLRQGLPTSPVSRAAIDTARAMREVGQVRALLAEVVQRRRTTVARLYDELEKGPSRGSALPRRVLLEVADGARSAPEAELRLLVAGSPVLPPALWNCSLARHGVWLADPDGYFEDAGLVLEYESRTWHASPDDWEATLARSDRLTAAGLRVLHVSPDRLRRNPGLVLATVEQAYAAGMQAGPPSGITVLRRSTASSARSAA